MSFINSLVNAFSLPVWNVTTRITLCFCTWSPTPPHTKKYYYHHHHLGCCQTNTPKGHSHCMHVTPTHARHGCLKSGVAAPLSRSPILVTEPKRDGNFQGRRGKRKEWRTWKRKWRKNPKMSWQRKYKKIRMRNVIFERANIMILITVLYIFRRLV